MKNFKPFFRTSVGMKPQSEVGGSTKHAYDYKHEVREAEAEHKTNKNRTPTATGKATGVGALIGGALGAGVGAFAHRHSPLHGALMGAGLGAAGGAGIGALTAMADRLGVEESKRVMKMSPKERKEYLAHKARQGEISQRETAAWARASVYGGRYGY